MLKRVFDMVIAISMIVLLLPLVIPVAIVLKFTGERQVFYVQPRVGKGGRYFGLIKFVTMVANSEQIGSKDITLQNDTRVLPVGRFLRKTKINELPQLINVLIGDMSIVGWRPLLRPGFERYPLEVQRELVTIKPGLTGVGSVVFRDEEQVLSASDKPYDECYRDEIMPYKGALEMWYIQHQTFATDLKIIAATVLAVLFPSTRWYLKMLPGLPDSPAPHEGDRRCAMYVTESNVTV